MRSSTSVTLVLPSLLLSLSMVSCPCNLNPLDNRGVKVKISESYITGNTLYSKNCLFISYVIYDLCITEFFRYAFHFSFIILLTSCQLYQLSVCQNVRKEKGTHYINHTINYILFIMQYILLNTHYNIMDCIEII